MNKEPIPFTVIFYIIMLLIGICALIWGSVQYICAEQLAWHLSSINTTIMNNISQAAQNVWRIP